MPDTPRVPGAVPPGPVSEGDLVAGRYRVASRIGAGGMAEIYRATDTGHRRTVAVKFLRPELSASIGADRFRREISIAATLSHPHIVPLFDSGEWRGRLYYVMPLVDGRDLREVLAEEGPLELDRALSIARDVGEALTYAHGRGVVHRDVKPGNIILTDDYAVVSDFGVAKALGSLTGEDLTGTGFAIGTPRYMAPEQATDPGRVTPRSDTYSFGCVVYEMLTGAPPFPGHHLPGLIADHLLHEPPSLDQLDPSIPLGVAEAVQRAIAKAPDRRFDTVADFVRTLERGARGRTVSSTRRHLPGLSRVAGTLAALALLLVGVLSLWRPGAGSGWAGDRPTSVVVVAYADAESTPRDRELAIRLADELTFELSWWDAVRPVPRVVQSGAMHDLGIDGPAVADVSQAIALARRLDAAAATVVRVTTSPNGENARAEYSLLRTETVWWNRGGSVVGQPTVVQAGVDPASLIEPMVRRLLGLETTVEDVVGRRTGTTSPRALRQFEEGQRALAAWRLAEAERHFDQAVAEDSTFAMAHLRLAQTLYFRVADDPGGMAADLGPRILRAGGAARRHARRDELPVRALDHIDGFYSFATGDYATARDRFETIVRRDPTDVFGHLMLGSVEFTDPWLEEGPTPGPRRDLNAAIRSFGAAVDLNPDFEIGYGHLFAIHRLARDAVSSSGCLGFEVPRSGVSLAPWDPRTPESLEVFCLVAGDSLTWVAGDRRDEIDRAASLAAADALLDRAVARLQRWIDYKPESARPLEELARVRRDAYERIPVAAPDVLEAAAAAAAEPLRRALALREDTAAAEVFRLANLEAAAGEMPRALELVGIGMRLHRAEAPDREVPSLAANPLLAAGRLAEARAVLRAPQRSAAIPGPDGEWIPVPPEAILRAQIVLAADALLGGREDLEPLLAEVEASLAGPGTSDARHRALRLFVGARMLAVLAPRADWVLDWTDPASDDPVTRVARAVATGAPEALAELGAAVADTAAGPSIVREFALARLALALDRPDVAAGRLAAVDSIAPPLRQFSSVWGMRTSARLLRAEVLLAEGDTAGARQAFAAFLSVVPSGDGLPTHLAGRADSVRARLGTGG